MSLKAFNLQLIIGRENIMGNKPKVLVQCFDIVEKNLFLGTNDCSIYHYLLLEDVIKNGTPENETAKKESALSAFLQNQKKLGLKKPITKLITCNEVNRLLVLVDNTLYVYNMMDLSIIASLSNKIKNISGLYVNRNPVHSNPFSSEICVSYLKKKSLQLFQISDDNLTLLRDVSYSDTATSLAVDGRHMCIASPENYTILDIDTSAKLELFPVTDQRPMVQKIASAEFLLTGPNSLGVFVTTGGISQRPPIQWSSTVFNTAYIHPYIVALDDEFISIHSIVDQQQKQTVPFQGGVQLLKSDNKILVCTKKDVFVLDMVPFEKQISMLLQNKMVEEAMNLSKACRKSMSFQEYQNMMNVVYRRSGFVYLQNMEFDLATEMFVKGELDPRELISLYPEVMPSQSIFIKSSSLHDIASINDLYDGKQGKEFVEYLADYLKAVVLPIILNGDPKTVGNGHFQHKHNSYRDDIFLSSVKAFCLCHKTDLLLKIFSVTESTFLEISTFTFAEFQPIWQEVLNILHMHECYHAEAIALLISEDVDGAFALWKKLSMGKLQDEDFPSLLFVAKCLAKYCTDVKQLWLQSEWILKLDQELGTELFTTYLPEIQKLHRQNGNVVSQVIVKPDEVIDFLHHYQNSVIDYLEYLVYSEKLEKEKYHTHLVVLYLESILQLLSQGFETEKLENMRKKFQAILKHSNLYRVTLILGKIKETSLYTEQVILHGKLGEHKEALNLLVNVKKAQDEAEEYCIEQAKNAIEKRQLFGMLLSIYISKASNNSSRATMSAISILNKHAENYDATEILNLLPDNWSVHLLQAFLLRTLRLPMHGLKTKQIENALAKADNLDKSKNAMKLQQNSVTLTEERLCMVCNKRFYNADCVFYPNGIVVHPKCGSNKFVCPVTGKMFHCISRD